MHRQRGRGLKQNGKRRVLCSYCGRRGIGQAKPAVDAGGRPVLLKTCHYCQYTERQEVKR